MAMAAESLVLYWWLKLLLVALLLDYVACEMDCLKPPEIANATYEILGGASKRLTLGTMVTYSCDAGYKMSDESVFYLHCALDEAGDKTVWIGKVPSCQKVKNCPDPGVSEHGMRTGNCCSEGDVLRYSCQSDFDLVGQEEIICLSTKNWSHSRPVCKQMKCHEPPEIANGTYKIFPISSKRQRLRVGTEVIYTCEPGYKVNDVSASKLKCAMDQAVGEAVWIGKMAFCQEISCPRPEPFANGKILKLEESTLESFPNNFELSYVCDKGYRLLGGDSWRICRKNGWSGKVPYCEEIRCPDPGEPDNGNREGSNFEVESRVRFQCSSGYDLLGSIERYCLPNGQWTGELARCDSSKNYCRNPGTPISGFKNSSRYDLGDKVRFRCQPGYVRVGSEVRECLAHGKWSGTETKCLSPYDFDNIELVCEMQISKVEDGQAEHLPLGRIPDLIFPGRLILYFAFDVSASIGEYNFRRSVGIAKSIIKMVGVSLSGTRVGALTFSSNARVYFIPESYNNTEDVLSGLDGIKYTGEGSDTPVLQIIRGNLPIDEVWLGRKRKTAVFLFTDGKFNMGGSPEFEAEDLKKLGVDIYCIGITGDARVDLLYKIASDSLYAGVERPNVFILENYPSVFHLIQMIMNGSSDYSQCGLGMENIIIENRGRILGGKRSDQPWPWMAAIFYTEGKNGDRDNGMQRYNNTQQKYEELRCGGSIINRNFILTAAHCMYKVSRRSSHARLRDKSELLVKLGVTDIKNQTFAQEFEVKMMHLHPKYKYGPSYDYDIALLLLDRQIEYSSYIRPICLPPKDLQESTTFYRSKEFGWATGWGHEGFVAPYDVSRDITISWNLKQVRLSIQSTETCTKSLEEKNYNTSYFTERMFCAGDLQSGNDTCYGDSGGPLMQPQMNSEGYLYWTQVGIVSWGFGCGVKELYGYYTHVHNLLPWIEQNTETVNNFVLDK